MPEESTTRGRAVLRQTTSIALWVLDMVLLAWALKNVTDGKGVLLLIGWLIFTPLAFWCMRRVDRPGWDEWMSRRDWWG
jgi:hypothetical protein